MVFQNWYDEIRDFKLSYIKGDSMFVLTEYQFRKTRLAYTHHRPDSILTMGYLINGELKNISANAIDCRELHLLQKGFYRAIDGRK